MKTIIASYTTRKAKDKEAAQQYLGAFRNNNDKVTMFNKRLQLESLKEACVNGYTICPAEFKKAEDGVKQSNWKSQQVVMIDIDNDDPDNLVTWNEVTNYSIAQGMTPYFVYASFTHTEAKHKFRLVYLLDKKVTDAAQMRNIIDQISNKLTFGGRSIVDTKCRTEGWVFFGGKQLLWEPKDFETGKPEVAVLKVSDFTVAAPKAEKVVSSTKAVSAAPVKAQEGVVGLIQKRDIMGFRKVLIESGALDSIEGLDFDSLLPVVAGDMFDILAKVEMHKAFGFAKGEKLSCIRPSHDDSTPSAEFRSDAEKNNGKEFYTCFGCMRHDIDTTGKNEKFSLSLFDFVDLLSDIMNDSRAEVLNFMRDVLNIRKGSDYQKKMREQLRENLAYFTGLEGNFKEAFPLIYKELTGRSNHMPHFKAYLEFAIASIRFPMLKNSDEAVIMTSLNHFAGILKDSGITKGASTSSIWNKRQDLKDYGLLWEADDCDLKEGVLKRAKEEATMNVIKGGVHIEVEQKMRQSFLVIPTYTASNLMMIEKHIADGIRYKRRKKFRGRALTEAVYGVEYADKKTNVQTARNKEKDEKIKKKVATKDKTMERFYNQFKKIALASLELKGYIFEKDVVASMRGLKKEDWPPKRKTEAGSLALSRVMREEGLVWERSNKENKDKYGITEKVSGNTQFCRKA